MAHLQSYDYQGWGTWARKTMSYTQAVRVGDRIIISGQGGWNPTSEPNLESLFPEDLEAEIDQAFANVDHTLKHAGGKGWSQVFKVTTLSTDIPAQTDFIIKNLKKWMPDHCATWTEIGVRELGAPTMHFEIEVEAHDEEGAAELKKKKKATSA